MSNNPGETNVTTVSSKQPFASITCNVYVDGERPPKTGFILDKSKMYLNYQPHSFLECLSIIDKQLNKT